MLRAASRSVRSLRLQSATTTPPQPTTPQAKPRIAKPNNSSLKKLLLIGMSSAVVGGVIGYAFAELPSKFNKGESMPQFMTTIIESIISSRNSDSKINALAEQNLSSSGVSVHEKYEKVNETPVMPPEALREMKTESTATAPLVDMHSPFHQQVAPLKQSDSKLTQTEDEKATEIVTRDHLDEIIRVQRQLFEIESRQKIEESLARERSVQSRFLDAALGQLEGIETALAGRIALDAENRRCKQFWIACNNLIESVIHGLKAGRSIDERRASVGSLLKVIQEANHEDPFVQVVIANFPSQGVQQGVYTKEDLKNRFVKIYKLGWRTASIDEGGGSIGKYLSSVIRSIFLLNSQGTFKPEEPIDPLLATNADTLAKASWFVERDDFESAIKLLQLLEGQPAQLAKDWIRDARAHLETRFLAHLLLAHAAV